MTTPPSTARQMQAATSTHFDKRALMAISKSKSGPLRLLDVDDALQQRLQLGRRGELVPDGLFDVDEALLVDLRRIDDLRPALENRRARVLLLGLPELHV